MNNNWLILDCNFLCHRAHHSTQGLTDEEGSPTGVIFGFLTSMILLQRKFDSANIIFCWDLGKSLRCEIYSDYKSNRHKPPKKATPEEVKIYYEEAKTFKKEVRKIRAHIVNQLGYQNNFYSYGLEADDWIAWSARKLERDESLKAEGITIITADHDLFQCVNKRTHMYSPIKDQYLTPKSIERYYGIEPYRWSEVKAIAGCPSDGVPGVGAVGEKTAIKYLKGVLPTHFKTYKAIKKNTELIERNRKIVKLPFKGMPDEEIHHHYPWGKDDWNKVMDEMGMETLIDQGPYAGKKGKKNGKRKLI